jgi:SAM-dependent methyltransferase
MEGFMGKVKSVRAERLESPEQWNNYFQSGWKENNGRNQTRLFAEAFAKHTRVDRLSCKSVLDSSCALGDALPVLRRIFPNAALFASDFSEVAIRQCKAEYGDLANFSVNSIEDIEGCFDIIYSSATLEHFADYKEKVRILLRHCKYLCILVPYNEQRFGRDLSPTLEDDHIATFRRNSFDCLMDEGVAVTIKNVNIFNVPGAWSWTAKDRVLQSLKNLLRPMFGRTVARNRQMLLFEIESSISI